MYATNGCFEMDIDRTNPDHKSCEEGHKLSKYRYRCPAHWHVPNVIPFRQITNPNEIVITQNAEC